MLTPLAADKWNFATAAHLLNRAGFGGTPDQINDLVQLGPDKAVASLVDYETIPDPTADPAWAKPDPDRMRQARDIRQTGTEDQKKQMQKEEQELERQRMLELRGWWIQRMAKGPRPFQEKMVLFWHGHFATSEDKVRDAYYMWRQNELFRRLGTGNWLTLLVYAAQDPAMLIWLDGAQNHKEHANENFAREVMELFTLGEGHYTETDITEAARAFTGWSLDRIDQRFVERPRTHDDGSKTFLGRTGDLDGADVLKQIVAQPQAGIFITAKLWNFFAGEKPDTDLNAALADNFRQNGNNFKPFLRTMFLSEEFYSKDIVRNQVKSPVQWLVGSIRMLECEVPPPLVTWGLTRNLGQDLFAPPNVKGWDGGLTWITTNNLLSRYNEAAAIVDGDYSVLQGMNLSRKDVPKKPGQDEKLAKRLSRLRPERVNINAIFTDYERTNKQALIGALQERLIQAKLKTVQSHALREFLDSRDQLEEEDILAAIRLVMSTPEYQLT